MTHQYKIDENQFLSVVDRCCHGIQNGFYTPDAASKDIIGAFNRLYFLKTSGAYVESELVKVIRAWDDYYLAHNEEYPAMEAHRALAKAITNLLKEER